MTKAQRLGYFRRWKQACICQGWVGMTKAENDARRHQEQSKALEGNSISSSMLSNQQIDKVFAWFDVLGKTTNMDAAIQADLPTAWNDEPSRNRAHPEMLDPGRVRRYRWVILNEMIPNLKQLGIQHPVEYVERICSNMFRTADLDRLSPHEVHDLMARLNNLVRAKKKALENAPAAPVDDVESREHIITECTHLAREIATYGAEEYLQTILNAEFELNTLDELDLAQLTQLHTTLSARARKKVPVTQSDNPF